MCYFARVDYGCGDWKWGNMKLRCPRQPRMGETCGAKLVHEESVEKISDLCKICQNIETKRRRLRKEQENIARWRKEGSKFAASIEKAETEAAALEDQIRGFWIQRPSIATKMNGQANGLGPSKPVNSTASSQAAAQSTGYGNSPASRHSQGGPVGHPPSGGYGYSSAPGGRHAPSHGTGSASIPIRHMPGHHAPTGSRHA